MTELKDRIVELHIAGNSYRVIQEILGCSKGTIAYYVGEGQLDKNNTRQRARRTAAKKWLDEYKTGRPCVDCGEAYPPYVMDFDHLPGQKKVENLSKLANRAWNEERLLIEIAKCDIVCANCHRIRTYARK